MVILDSSPYNREFARILVNFEDTNKIQCLVQFDNVIITQRSEEVMPFTMYLKRRRYVATKKNFEF